MSRLLIVEDEAHIASGLCFNLEADGHQVTLRDNGEAALAELESDPSRVDLVVLDVMLPGIDGFAVASRMRAKGWLTPILMLTARGRAEDVLRGFEAGADDYLPKPFAVDELLARLRALARRPPETLPTTLSFDDLELDTAARVAHRQGREIRLTAREFALLEYLMRNPNRVLDRARILEHVWDDNFDPVANAVDVLVGRVRRKVDPDGERPLIFTLRGMGYMLSARRPAGAA